MLQQHLPWTRLFKLPSTSISLCAYLPFSLATEVMLSSLQGVCWAAICSKSIIKFSHWSSQDLTKKYSCHLRTSKLGTLWLMLTAGQLYGNPVCPQRSSPQQLPSIKIQSVYREASQGLLVFQAQFKKVSQTETPCHKLISVKFKLAVSQWL